MIKWITLNGAEKGGSSPAKSLMRLKLKKFCRRTIFIILGSLKSFDIFQPQALAPTSPTSSEWSRPTTTSSPFKAVPSSSGPGTLWSWQVLLSFFPKPRTCFYVCFIDGAARIFPITYAATGGNRTHVNSVAPFWGTLIQDALPSVLPRPWLVLLSCLKV